MFNSVALPQLSEFSVEFSCDVSLVDPIPVTVNWMYGSRLMGVVYPGVQDVNVELSPGNYACTKQSDISCTAHIARNDIFNITITQTSDLGPTVYNDTIDIRVLVVERQVLSLETQQFDLVISRNSLCPETDSPVLVTFGAMAVTGGDCVGQQNTTARPIPPGTSVSFFVDAATISLGQDQIYCFNVILDGVTVLSGAGASGIPTDTTGGGNNVLSPEAAVGIAVGVILLVVVPVGVVLGCCGMWFIMRSRGKKDLHGNEGEKRELGAIYEDPSPPPPAVETAITISENEAYGQVPSSQQRS